MKMSVDEMKLVIKEAYEDLEYTFGVCEEYNAEELEEKETETKMQYVTRIRLETEDALVRLGNLYRSYGMDGSWVQYELNRLDE